ncbi:MAG: carbonic anhydrase family protein [Bdellovibrionales bacterium]|nr:carbonic anhydrase family protein [Bdellovibrionales bacterium]
MIRRLISAAALTFIVGCSSAEKVDIPPPLEDGGMPQAESTSPVVAPASPVDAVWSYSGAFAPQYWGDLDPSFIMCKEGKHQSPVDLKWQKPTKNNPFTAAYNTTKVSVEDTGNLLRLRPNEGGNVKMRTSVYNLQTVDFHSPSEHSLSGKSFPLEIQFIHKNDKDFYAVVSVFVKSGKANPIADQIIASFPEGKSASKEVTEPLALSSLLPAKMTLYNYAGSLTYPPCSEGVNWVVLNTSIEFSKEQIAAFENRYSKNNRPKQKLNDRSTINY